ncbi:MAG: histidine triad nucleotide-binding protein [bacterium]
MAACLFCRIVNGEIPAEVVYEDELVMAFKDVNPQAPIHLLLVPKKHLANLLELAEADKDLSSHFLAVINKLAQQYDLKGKGFRTVINTGEDGGQTVEHLHFHLLGGRFMGWPPG